MMLLGKYVQCCFASWQTLECVMMAGSKLEQQAVILLLSVLHCWQVLNRLNLLLLLLLECRPM
jgi:membrane glycosyltransferase